MQWGRPPAVCSPGGTRCQAMPEWEEQLGQQVAVSFQGPVKKGRCPEKGKKNPILSRTWFLLSLKVWWRGYLLQEAPPVPSDRCSCLKRHNDTLV